MELYTAMTRGKTVTFYSGSVKSGRTDSGEEKLFGS
jgi:hypothetical protein